MDNKNKELTTPPPASQERGDADRVIRRLWSLMGPKVPPCCEGCNFEWTKAIEEMRAYLGSDAYPAASPPSSAPPSYCPHCGQRDDGVLACCERYMEPPSSAAESDGDPCIECGADPGEPCTPTCCAAEQAKPVAELVKDGPPYSEKEFSRIIDAHAEQAQAGESREARMVVVERDADGKPTVWCDPEIVDLVTALNAAGIRTVASCSGHGEQHGNIALADGRELIIVSSFEAARKMEAQAGKLPSLPEATRCHSYSCCHRNVYTTDQMRDYANALRLAGGVTVDDAAIHRAADAYATSLAERYGEGDGDIVAMRAAVEALGAK